MGTNRDAAAGPEGTASSDPFDLDKLPDQLENSWKTLIGKGVNPQKARELYVAAEGKYQEALRTEGEQRRGHVCRSRHAVQGRGRTLA